MEYKLLKVYRRLAQNGDSGKPLWEHAEIVDLRKGDIFTMVQPNGELVEYKKEVVLYAMSDTFLNEDTKDFMVEMTSLKEWREANEKA
jgi:hypothetical protein